MRLLQKQVDLLLGIPETIYYPPLRFSPFVKAEMKKYILENWSSRPGKKTPSQIMAELLHDCTQEYLTKLMLGAGSTPGLNEDIARKTQEMDVAKTNEDKRIYADLIQIKLEEISKLFTEGYTGVFRENLLFDDEGRPIAVREGDDRTYRFPKCHERLAEDHAARQFYGVDPESSAVSRIHPGITAGGVRRAVLTRRKKQKKPKNQKKTKKQKPVRCTRKRRSSRA